MRTGDAMVDELTSDLSEHGERPSGMDEVAALLLRVKETSPAELSRRDQQLVSQIVDVTALGAAGGIGALSGSSGGPGRLAWRAGKGPRTLAVALVLSAGVLAGGAAAAATGGLPGPLQHIVSRALAGIGISVPSGSSLPGPRLEPSRAASDLAAHGSLALPGPLPPGLQGVRGVHGRSSGKGASSCARAEQTKSTPRGAVAPGLACSPSSGRHTSKKPNGTPGSGGSPGSKGKSPHGRPSSPGTGHAHPKPPPARVHDNHGTPRGNKTHPTHPAHPAKPTRHSQSGAAHGTSGRALGPGSERRSDTRNRSGDA